jgi:hypothetical protein
VVSEESGDITITIGAAIPGATTDTTTEPSSEEYDIDAITVD